MSTALATVDPVNVISRYLAGETTTKIAAELGVTRQGLDYHLRRNHESEFKNAQVILALERKQLADEAMETACDALALARAREQLKSAQWDLERVCRRIYGQDQPVTSTGLVTINIGIARDAAQHAIIEHEPIQTGEKPLESVEASDLPVA